MGRKLALAIALLIVLVFLAPIAVSAEISVGVKSGDWIEYQVVYEGTPPEGHDVVWARMDVVSVKGKDASLAIAAKLSDVRWLNETVALNLETGQLEDDFMIPANLSSGNTFFDKRQGNISITGVEERTYASAKRLVMTGNILQTAYYRDRAAGVIVEGNSSYTDFSIYIGVEKTNMWQSEKVEVDSDVLSAYNRNCFGNNGGFSSLAFAYGFFKS